MIRPLVLGTILAALVLGGVTSAQSLHVGVRLGGAIAFPGVTGLVAGAQVEGRGLGLDWLSARLSAALASGIGLDLIARLDGGAPGPAYFGIGLGVPVAGPSTGLEARLVAGYHWPLTPGLGAFVEAMPRLPLSGGGPRLDLVAGLSLRVLGPPAP